MNITKYSRNRIMMPASRWAVPREYFDPLYNYLVHGFDPGGFWTAVLTNDFMLAMQRSHPSNHVPQLKNTVGWIQDYFPPESWGSSRAVRLWQELSSASRRCHLESQGLIYSEQQEVVLVLKNASTHEPMLY